MFNNDGGDDSNNMKKNVIFICEKMNWGEIGSNVGEWLSTKWTVYADKTMVCETKYDGCVFSATESKTYIKNIVLSDEDFTKLDLWLKDVFPFASVSGGCDGIGWRLTSFDESGNILHTVAGYIDNIMEFEIILQYFCE